MSTRERYFDAELPRTRCPRDMREGAEEIAARDQRDISFVIRRAVRELIERDRRKKSTKGAG